MPVPFWYPVLDHPAAGTAPWYRIDDLGRVFRAHGHPRGPANRPTFSISDDIAYSTGYGTDGGVGVAWFKIVGSMVYRAHGHPVGESDAPRYQVRD